MIGINNFLANNFFQFVSYWGMSYALSQCAQWIVKDYYTKPKNLSLENFVQHLGILAVANQLYIISITYTPPHLWAYQILSALLAITIYTDMYAMLIANMLTVYCVPLALTAAYFELLPITFNESIFATLTTYVLAQSFYYLVYKIMEKEGIGMGDIDLLLLLAATTGFYGTWCAISVGSYLATFYGLIYMLIYRTKNFKLPFGTFLGYATLLFLASDFYITFYNTSFKPLVYAFFC